MSTQEKIISRIQFLTDKKYTDFQIKNTIKNFEKKYSVDEKYAFYFFAEEILKKYDDKTLDFLLFSYYSRQVLSKAA